MKLIKKSICILLLAAMPMAMIGCGNNKDSIDDEENEKYAAEEIKFDYKSETDLLKKYPTFIKGEDVEFTYDFDCAEYKELLEKYPIKEIAGEGSEFERAMRLVDEYSGRLTHESKYDNKIEENALALLEYSLDNPQHGINCRAKGEILNEMCLALGIYARRVSINPYSSIDNDSHVVNEIYDTKMNKWIMVDMTTDSYVVDGKDNPLSVLEIRQCGVDNADCYLVSGDSKIKAGVESVNMTGSLTYYMKNLFFLKISLYQGFGIKDNLDEVAYFVPEEFDIKKRLISSEESLLEMCKQDSQYKDWIKDCEDGIKELKTATIKVGNIDSLK